MLIQTGNVSTQNLYSIQRVVSVFDKTNSSFVGMWPLRSFNLDYFLHAFEVPNCDPLMHEFYEVTPAHLGVLRHETIEFDFDRYTYYVECARCSPEVM